MWKFFILLLLFTSALLLPCVSAAEPLDYEFQIEITESYFVQENYLKRKGLELINDLHFTEDDDYNLVNIHPSLTFTAGQGVQGYFSADFSWQNPVEDDEGEELTADLTTAYLSLQGDRLSVDLGLQPIQFGNGLIMADDTLAATAHLNLGDGYAELKAARVMDRSPMVGLTLGYRPGFFEHVEIFGIWYSDRDNTFAYSVPLIYQLLFDLNSEGDLYFFGAAGQLFVGDTLLSLVGAYQTGSYTLIDSEAGEVNPDVKAYFGDISLQRNLTDWFTAELFCFITSGDKGPIGPELETFVSITPYNPRAAIFFDPDFLGLNDTQQFTYSGGFAAGVIAPGLNLSVAFDNGFAAEAALVYMFAEQALGDGSRWYGWEVDLSISYTFAKYYELFVEAARFEHGDYYESFLAEEVEPAMQLSVGLSATF